MISSSVGLIGFSEETIICPGIWGTWRIIPVKRITTTILICRFFIMIIVVAVISEYLYITSMITIITKMDNKSIFKALSSQTRIRILKILIEKEMHISGVAKTIGISVPVTARHVNILEKSGLIRKRIIGNIHLLSTNMDGFKKVFEPFIEEEVVHIEKDDTLFDALQQIPSIKFKKMGKNRFISEIDGEEGYYLYDVDGKTPDISIDEFIPKKDVILELDRIIPVHKRKIRVKIKKERNK
jgi:DNA-binding transcriptional ArsR family regulator